MLRRPSLFLGVFVLVVGFVMPTRSDGQALESKRGVVVTVSRPGSEAGLAILKEGGNAVDAAVATAFALAVTHPAAGNIGGGGFMVVHPPLGRAKKAAEPQESQVPSPFPSQPTVVEYRETAPAAAHKLMYDQDDRSYGHRIVGVPGMVRGMALAHQRFGKLPWKSIVMPAVVLAEAGFQLDQHHASSLNSVVASAQDFAELRRVFGKADGKPWSAGDRLVQPDLARTLRLIAEKGPDAFYTGAIADLIVAEMKAGGGIITHEDLANYRAMERAPIHGVYRGYDVYAPPPPSSGGICLVQMLNVLENFELAKRPRFAPETLHLMAEAMRRAFCDRARYLGDPAFTKIPAFLSTKEYAKKLAAGIHPAHATPSADLAKDIRLAGEGDSTTHFSIMDREGLAVSNTYTLEHSYGSRVVVRGAGFLLNNEMMDFNRRPGVTDRKGTIGTDANLIAPGKRMLSSQTPTIVAKDGKVVLVTGSPGGRTIINTVLGVVVSVIDYDMPIDEAVNAPRLHHQWFPDELRLEGLKNHAMAAAELKRLGHRVVNTPKQGDAHSIWVHPRTGGYVGAADKRLSGFAAGY